MPYVVAQVIGAVLGAAIVLVVASGRPGYSIDADGLGTTATARQSTGGYGLLPWRDRDRADRPCWFSSSSRRPTRSPPPRVPASPSGATLVVAHLIAIGIDSTSGQSGTVVGAGSVRGSIALSQLWVFVVFPLIGGVVGAVLHLAISSGREETTVSA